MQLHNLTCSSESLHAVTWACMEFHGFVCSCMSLNAVPWAYIQFHDLTCSSVSLHAVPSAFMLFHELTCSSSISFHAVPWAFLLYKIHKVFMFVSPNLMYYLVCISCPWRPGITPHYTGSVLNMKKKIANHKSDMTSSPFRFPPNHCFQCLLVALRSLEETGSHQEILSFRWNPALSSLKVNRLTTFSKVYSCFIANIAVKYL